jgi:transketolase
MMLPEIGQPLNDEQVAFMKAFSKSCRRSILKMVTKAQSGHPGGSLSSVDFISLVSALRLTQTNEAIVVSIGHISPAVYSVLAELGIIPKERVIEYFRRPEDLYEGHVNRKIQGIFYGTGPLGVGTSAATGFALGNKLGDSDVRLMLGEKDQGVEGRMEELMKGTAKDELVFFVAGDGESQEGQVYEMMNFAAKFELGNLIQFVDYNKVQLSDSLEEVMPIDIEAYYKAAGWHVQEVDGHDFVALWDAISAAAAVKDKPSVILGMTTMGHGVEFMAETGRVQKANWHGKAPKIEQADEALGLIELNEEELAILKKGLAALPMNIRTPNEPELGRKMELDLGESVLYEADVFTDCRSAYGAALLDLAERNKNVLAMTADVAGSVKTNGVKNALPDQHIECGIAEQHMVSTAGGLSIRGYVPFCSTFGAFMSSRAKDQARVNDINECNAKMVATHCGLSVGEDGPTHQAIDDISSFLGFMHTNIFEPADPNQCDRIIRHVAGVYGNVYVRMGRSKLPIILKEDGTPFFDLDYKFEEGKADVLRKGDKVTLVAAGPMVERALKAADQLEKELAAQDGGSEGGRVEVICVSSFVPFDDETIVKSAQKTNRVVSVHDHHVRTGLGMFVSVALQNAGVMAKHKTLGVDHYQLSGKADELYELAGLGIGHIVEAAKEIL